MSQNKKEKEYTYAFLEETSLTSRLSDQVYEILRNAIISWKIPPGEKLLQEKLANDFGVSQMTIREALNRLTADGLTTQEPYRGTRVISLSLEDLIDIYEIRARLEGHAMELAVHHITDGEIGEMQGLAPLAVMDADQYPQSVEKAREANHKFHWIAINASRRPYLIYHLRLVWAKIDPYLIYNPWLHSKLSRAELIEDIRYDFDIHQKMIKALEARDGKALREITEEMIGYSLESYKLLMSLANKIQ